MSMYLNVPGLRNSAPDHWQSIWEKEYPEDFIRIEQKNWDHPDRKVWVSTLDQQIRSIGIPFNDIILVGHSVGCATIVHWLMEYDETIKGTFLVAPSDVDRASYPPYITGFSPMPLAKLKISSLVVASTNDHVVTLERANYFAKCWGSQFKSVENGGHFEGKSGFGQWETEFSILKNFL